MRRALVTGATSYLGRELCRRLMADGVAVHAVVRPGSELARFDPLPRRPELHVHEGGTEQMIAIVREAAPDTVFHLATLYLREHEPGQIERLVESNVLFGTELLEGMRAAGARRLVNAGTAFQFYDSEGYRPLNLYAATKQAFADIMAYYEDADGLAAVTLVLYDLYGPGDWRAKLFAAIRDAQDSGRALPLPDEDAVMDLVYVDDAVSAFAHAARLLETRADEVAGKSFAVSAGARHSLSEVVSAFEEAGGRAIETAWGAFETPKRRITRPWEGPRLPGWRAEVDLREGVRRFLSGE